MKAEAASIVPRATPQSGSMTPNFDFGEAAPLFEGAALDGNDRFSFDTVAGRLVVMLFAGSASWAPCTEALALLTRNADLFDDQNAAFFGVTIDPTDAPKGRIARRIPGIRWFKDYDARISVLYGAARGEGGQSSYVPHWLLLDSTLRLVMRVPIADGEHLFSALRAMLAAGPEQTHAPVLMVPRVLEPELCRTLIRLYDENGGKPSGFMRERQGKTVAVMDDGFKRRADYYIQDPALMDALLNRLRRRLIPEIVRAFQYQPTRIERWMVGCYDSETGGFFRPHRDNTTAGTAHRVFACTINLNAEEYDGGDLRFPEYGSRSYRAPTGGAVIFSCSLQHEALPVTRGRRYAFLPFFYDEAKAQLRERNQIHFAAGEGSYRADPGAMAAEAEPESPPQP